MPPRRWIEADAIGVIPSVRLVDGERTYTNNQDTELSTDPSSAPNEFGAASGEGDPASPTAFAYWDSDDRSKLAGFNTEWRMAFPGFRIYGDRDVVPVLAERFPEYVELYRAIRIPAAKADIARLMLLHRFGGLYVDCHCGIRDAAEVRRLLASLGRTEAIFVDRARRARRGSATGLRFINGIILARPNSQLIETVARQALVNLSFQREFERLAGRVAYDVFRLTGPDVLNRIVLEGDGHAIRPDYRDRIEVIDEDAAPIVLGRNRDYASPDRHWSQLEKVEPLFEPPST